MKLHAETLGETGAAAILFISGMVGSSRAWNHDFRALNKHFRVVLIDTLGFGQSPKPDIPYSIEDHVNAISDTLDALEIRQAHVVGHSMGCLLALAFAQRFPWRVRKMGMLALPLFTSEAEARAIIKSSSLFNRWLATDTPLAEAVCRMMCRLRPWLIRIAPLLVRNVPALVAKDTLHHTWESYSRTLQHVIFEAPTLRWLEEVKHPMLLVHGTLDTTAPLPNVRRRMRSLFDGTFMELEAGHGLVFSHSRLIAARLETFFQDAADGNGRHFNLR